ncbi:hypothetical protein BG004_005423 [Podila humilis]|nr:hypothetical protein BG004_005423 [Podila humilis]
MQQRGQLPTHYNELKYSVIRPVHTDRTAIPITSTAAPNAYFLPAVALVSAGQPTRWIWWGTEALQMVVFGRQLKNIFMEWRWKHGRSRIGGPVVSRVIGCSFRVTPERRYCWKQGTGTRRNTIAAIARQRHNQSRSHVQAQDSASATNVMPNRLMGGSGWFGSFFASRSNAISASENNLPMVTVESGPVRVVVSPPQLDSSVDVVSSVNEPDISTTDSYHDDFDGGEVGAYHCREEDSEGITGRIVAIYKPGRPANRALDRPATSQKLEIFVEVGERCETAMMLMCARIDDLFMSIPDQKRAPLVSILDDGGSNARMNTPAGSDINVNPSAEAGEGGLEQDLIGTNVNVEEGQRVQATFWSVFLGDRRAWKQRTKWITCAVLVVVVILLVLKPKLDRL